MTSGQVENLFIVYFSWRHLTWERHLMTQMNLGIYADDGGMNPSNSFQIETLYFSLRILLILFIYLCVYIFALLKREDSREDIRKKEERKKEPIFMLCRRRPSRRSAKPFFLWLHTHPAAAKKESLSRS